MAMYPTYNYGIERIRKVKKERLARELIEEEGKKLSELAGGYNFFPDMIDHHYADYVGKVGTDISVPKGTKKIVIVGGGIAGLTAGIELIRSGLDVDIYDGADRVNSASKKDSNVGGRFCTSTISSPDTKYHFSAEMGAMRFPIGSKVFWKYFQHALTTLKTLPPGITDRDPVIYPFPNSGVVPTAILFKGTLYSYEFGTKDIPDKFQQVRKKVGAFIAGIAVTYPVGGESITLKQVADWCKTDIGGNEDIKDKIQWFWSQMIVLYDSRSFGDVIKGIGLTSGELETFYSLGFGTGGFGPLYPISFLEILRLNIWDFDIEYALPITSTQFAIMLKDLLYAEKCNDAQPSWGKITWINSMVIGIGRSPVPKFYYAVRDNSGKGSIQVRSDARAFIAATSHRNYTTSLNLDAPYKAFVGEETNLDTGAFSWKNNNAVSPYHGNFLDTTVASMKVLHTLSSSKIFCVLPKPWINNYWPKVADKPVRVILSDTLSMQMYWLDQNPDSGDVLCLAAYLWGDECRKNQADKYYTTKQVGAEGRLAVCQVLAASLEAYSRAQDADNPDPSKDIKFATLFKAFQAISNEQQVDDIVWEDEPLIHTAFKLSYPGEVGNTMSLVYQFQMASDNFFRANDYGNIFLAGESCSFYGGWAEGAMISGINASSGVLTSIMDNTQQSQAPAFNIANTLSRYDNCNVSKQNFISVFQTDSEPLALGVFIGGKLIKKINIVTQESESQPIKQVATELITSPIPKMFIAYRSGENLFSGELNLDTFEWDAPPSAISGVVVGADGYVTLEHHRDMRTHVESRFLFYQGSNKSLRRYDLTHKKDIEMENPILVEDTIHSVEMVPFLDPTYHVWYSATLVFLILETGDLGIYETIDSRGRASQALSPIKNVIRNSGSPTLFSRWISEYDVIINAFYVVEGDTDHLNIMCMQVKYTTKESSPPTPIYHSVLFKQIKKMTSTPSIYIFTKKINDERYLFYKQQNDIMRVLVFDDFIGDSQIPESIKFRADRPYTLPELAISDMRVLDIVPFSL